MNPSYPRDPLRPSLRAFIASVLVCGAGLAEPIERGDFRIAWKAPADCPTDRETLARVEALLGARVSEMKLVPLAARGRVTAIAPGHYELVLETFQGEQRFLRTMQAGSCAELTDAGALVLALAIDPTLSERRASATPGHDATSAKAEAGPDGPPSAAAPSATTRRPPPRSRPPRPATSAPSRPPSPARPLHHDGPVHFLVGARAVVDFGSIADVAVGPGVGLALQWRGLEASLDGVWLPRRRTLAEPGKGGDISLTATNLRACYRPLAGTFEALGCVVFELGSLDGDGVGTVVRTHRSGLWAAPGGMVGGRVRLGSRILVALGAGALVPIQPIDFTLDNVGLVRRVPPLVARVEAGLSAHFD